MAEQAKTVYFGVQARKRLELEDGQWIEVKKLSEAERNEYLNKVGSVAESMDPETGNMKIDPARIGDMRRITLDMCVNDFSVDFKDEKGEVKRTGGAEMSWPELYNSLDPDTDIVNRLQAIAEELNFWMTPKPSGEREKKSNA